MSGKQKATIIVLLISVLGLAMGFAAFSNVLTIRSAVEVTPNASDFRLVFANNTNVNNLDYSAVQPVNSNPLGGSGTINNQDNPTLTGLSASFTTPGQSVSYKLYVVNTGKYLAHLTNLDFKNAQGAQSFKSCTGSEVNPSILTAACSDITVTVTLGGTDGVGGTTFSSNSQTLTNEINNISLAAGASQEVYVTISYADNNHYVDGLVSITFGDIMLQYRSINESTTIADLNDAEDGSSSPSSPSSPSTPQPEQQISYSAGDIYTGDFISTSSGIIADYVGNAGSITIPASLARVRHIVNATYNSTKCNSFASEHSYPANYCENAEKFFNGDKDYDKSIFKESAYPSSIEDYIADVEDHYEVVDGVKHNITVIGYNAFQEKSITSVIIPSGVTAIRGDAFSGNRITSVTIPSSVTTIDGYAFYNNSLTSVDLSEANSLTTIGAAAFSGNRITSVTIPSSVTTIQESAFSSNELSNVRIYNNQGNVTINDGAFDDGTQLQFNDGTIVFTKVDGKE